MPLTPNQAARERRLLDSAAQLAAGVDARTRTSLLISIVRVIASTTDDGSGLWTAERSSLSLVIDAVLAHERRIAEIPRRPAEPVEETHDNVNAQ